MRKLVSYLGIAALVIGFSLTAVHPAKADVVITPAAGGTTISADTFGTGAWTNLANIIIAEGANGDIAIGAGVTLILTAPAGFEFNAAGGTDVVAAGAADINAGTIAIAFPAANKLRITMDVGGVAALDTITIGGVTPIQVRPTAGCPLGNGNILRTVADPGTAVVAGITNDTTNFGTLTEVAGAMLRLAVRLPGQAAPACAAPAGAVTAQIAGTAFNITNIYAVDQYFNTDTTYIGAKTLAYAGPTLPATYTTAVTFAVGVNTTVLATTLNTGQTATITVTDGGLFGLASSLLTINPAEIAILACTATGQAGTVLLSWTVPAGTSAGYQVRYSLAAITNDGHHVAATNFVNTWPSGTVGVAAWNLVNVLSPNGIYWFSMKALGANATISAIPTNLPVSCTAPATGGSSTYGDAIAPTSNITQPVYGTQIPPGTNYTIKGNAADTGGSSVQKVEVSLDGGTTWHLATIIGEAIGTNRTWEYTWQNTTLGTYTIKTRAYDWMNNVETPGTGIQVTVTTSVTVPTTPTTPTTTPPPTAPETTSTCFTKTLVVGSTGTEVTLLQTKLGVTPITGYFGPITKAAVLKFQTDNGISPAYPQVGPLTRAKLNALYCGNASLAPTVPGCQAGDLFSSTTGASCTTTLTIPGCLAGYLFSVTTGARCTAN